MGKRRDTLIRFTSSCYNRIKAIFTSSPPVSFPVEADQHEIDLIKTILGMRAGDEALSMVSVDRLWAAIAAVKYIEQNNIDGDIVECGVWRGGCAIAMADTLRRMRSNKKVYLFDTFEGMTLPTKEDIMHDLDIPAQVLLDKSLSDKEHINNVWCVASLEDVKQKLNAFNVADKCILVPGDVCLTLFESSNIPEKISLLRLDTDWYESTKVELNQLYPLLSMSGILLVDDYGFWEGSRKAVDEFFNSQARQPMQFVLDQTGRGYVKI
ncbi:MAG: macrocin O-methyltransferase [Blastopirellula sp.]|nr:macrocin O-methyltransferase [Blastopirellula sp.]